MEQWLYWSIKVQLITKLLKVINNAQIQWQLLAKHFIKDKSVEVLLNEVTKSVVSTKCTLLTAFTQYLP